MFALIVCFTVCSLQDLYFGSHFAVLVIVDSCYTKEAKFLYANESEYIKNEKGSREILLLSLTVTEIVVQ